MGFEDVVGVWFVGDGMDEILRLTSKRFLVFPTLKSVTYLWGFGTLSSLIKLRFVLTIEVYKQKNIAIHI